MKAKYYFTGIILFIFVFINNYAQQDKFSDLKGPYLGQKPLGMTPVRFKPEGFKRGQYAEPVFLFFSEGRECLFTGEGGIYYTGMKNGNWTHPINTNTYGGYADFEPNISPDESFLIFDSENRPRKNRCGLFVSFSMPDDSWTEPINLGDY